MRRPVWVCTNGANIMTGAKAGVVALLRALQQEVIPEAYFVAMHANCHRAGLAFKDALKEAHVFLDVLNDGLPIGVTRSKQPMFKTPYYSVLNFCNWLSC